MTGSTVESTERSSTCWKIIHIPDRPPIPPDRQPTINVHAAAIEPQHANTIVRKLNHISPLETLCHVKRVHKRCLDGGKIQLFVVLCIASEDDNKCNNMPDEVLELVNFYKLSTFTTKVCRYAASTKEEWKEQCKIWPTSFHPPTYNIEGITGFSEEDSQSIFHFMKFAISLSRSDVRSVVNAAVIVDPSTKHVIASSLDKVLPSKCSFDDAKLKYNRVSCLYPWNWTQQELSLDPWHPLQHAAIVAIETSAARDRRLFPLNGPTNGHTVDEFVHDDQNISSSEDIPPKRQKMDDSDVKDDQDMSFEKNGLHSNSARPYLCTGYDIFIVWEPCIMCAMALVHQRIRRIFYAFPNESDGALGSVHRLQGEKSLNHHYAVFRVLIPDDC